MEKNITIRIGIHAASSASSRSVRDAPFDYAEKKEDRDIAGRAHGEQRRFIFLAIFHCCDMR
jgi:hypothetical protein